MITTPVLPDSAKALFPSLVSQWKEQSKFMSNTAQMALLVPYQRIIGMGPAVVPAILDELRRDTDHWFWALEMITGENPVPFGDRGNVEAMKASWLDWGAGRGLLS